MHLQQSVKRDPCKVLDKVCERVPFVNTRYAKVFPLANMVHKRVRSWTSDGATPNKALLSIPHTGVEGNETYLVVRLATNRPSLFLIRTTILSLAKLISSWSCDVKILPSWSGELVNTHNATEKLTLLRSGIGRSSDDVRPSR